MRGKSFAANGSTLPSGLSDHNAELPGDVVTSLFINFEWRRLISDALQSYADSIIFRLDDALVDDFRNKIQALLNDLYSVESMDSPVGMVSWFPVWNAQFPAKWLAADGAILSAIDYPDLYAAMANTPYVTGHVYPNFALPDLREKFLFGAEAQENVGSSGGESEHMLTIDEIPTHSHVIQNKGGAAGAILTNAGYFASTATPYTQTTTPTATTGGGLVHNNMPPYIVGRWLIKALP